MAEIPDDPESYRKPEDNKNGNEDVEDGTELAVVIFIITETTHLRNQVNRILVVKYESLEFSPVENAIGMIETQTALRNELEEPRSSEGEQLPRLQSLQRISLCCSSGEHWSLEHVHCFSQLIAALFEFMAVCKRAIRVHFRLIGEEDQDFHTQLVNGFQSLTAELSHYFLSYETFVWL
ncbi:hypothetical protein NE237_031913 [Protea cynaroides]|uniref:DOCKER Lobe C domain-containing protein n=1 Tax=Protea cynaroides TaxID=273540 RepID=A0A9Q0L323_9MAGN|nr:hypothetical protein NE237_031913 [Protea cynaroides]